MIDDLNPQGPQMSDESMVRNLRSQAEAIWPQESLLFERYNVRSDANILDAGCGTGEITSRLGQMYPSASVLGVDIIDAHLELARSRYAALNARVTFEHQSIYELQAENDTFDLTVCRHVIHSIPYPERVIAELVRVTKPGGYLHLIPEDYGMLQFQRGALDPSDFWHTVPRNFEAATGTDLYIGRNIFTILHGMGFDNVTLDYVVVDTLRVPRETFANIIEAWRDGYVDPIAEYTPLTREEARAYFDQMIADIRNPNRYAVWMVPVVSARCH